MSPYYADDMLTLWHGDALTVLGVLPAESFRMVALDPPYSMVPSAVRGVDDGSAGASGSPVMLLSESFRQAYRLLVDGGVAAIVCDWRRVPDVSYLATLANLRLASCVAWTRSTLGTGGLFRSAWDPVLVASKGSPGIVDRSGIPNVVHANRPRPRAHPYEKPVGLWRHILDRLPAGPLLDPFAGSGSAGEAARLGGRKAVLIEADERHCEAIVRRVSQGVLDGGES